ncbi:MAG: hypothetical protein HYT40_02895 [Candidatus Sungbacteria bacterium]|uniref:Uncharacterized protein n=1 Tax=Candidatus Sungiibacteriota bacterium TaxID=2750080 RepID=A0A931SDG6_9BACT|nr:hypothetical protein [Candidatus Sungbacteria bacterium]
MVQAILLNDATVNEVTDFYEAHAHYGLRYPRDPQWIHEHLGTDFFLFGLRVKDELIAVAWAVNKKDFVYFVLENDSLIIKDEGHYADSGGWCIRPDYQGKKLFQLLTATVLAFWFNRIHKGDAPRLWGRMIGQKDDDGNPLFWNRIGERITGLSYHELLKLPFDTMEGTIFARWPKDPLPLTEIPKEILHQTLGKSLGRLVVPKDRFIQWGLIEVTDRYVPTSLNHFVCATKEGIPDAEGFLQKALANARETLGNY